MSNVRVVCLAFGAFLSACCGIAAEIAAKGVSIQSYWKDGDYEWPSAYPKLAVTDWTEFDRLVVDVSNLADGGDVVTLVFQSPETPKNGGKYAYLRAPDWETIRWEIPLGYYEDGKTSATNITKMQIYSHRAKHLHATFSGFYLLRPGEKAPEAQLPPKLADDLRVGRTDYERRQAERRAAFVRELKSANEKDGVSNGKMLYGIGTGMDQVRPKATFALASAGCVRVRLARNEWEGRQIFVTPVRESLRDVRVSVSPLKLKSMRAGSHDGSPTLFPSECVQVAPVGYVKTTASPRYGIGRNVSTNVAPGYMRQAVKAELGWWPDLLLSFMDSVDVAENDVQSFWISVHAPEGQAPGVYEGTVLISAANAKPIGLPLEVRVNGFTLPKVPVIPTLVSFSPGVYIAPDHKREHTDLANRLKEDPESPINLWSRHRIAWGDFLADHFITLAPMYHHGTDLPYDIWMRLMDQGRMGFYNLCYFSSQPVPKTPAAKNRWNVWSDWVSSVIAKNYAKAKEVGLEKNCLVYCCDEATSNRFPEIDTILEKLKARHPEIPFLTTSFDDTFGMGKSLGKMDWFCPPMPKFDTLRAEKARAAGHKVWWYFACEQRAPFANMYTEGSPMEIRLIMGAMSALFRPDGFLYYQCAYFNNPRCVTTGPYTDWNPRSWWNQHGDATWVGVGPDGVPLSTIRLENFRDGLEDLAYVKLLEKMSGRRVDVPESVFSSLTNFTDDPYEVERWRDRLADYLEAANESEGGDLVDPAGLEPTTRRL